MALTPQDLALLGPAAVPLDLTCVGCGYMLYGQHADGRCPECGLSVGPSLDGYAARRRRLASCPQWAGRWMRRLRCLVRALRSRITVGPLPWVHLGR